MAPLTKKALRQVSTFLTIGLLLGTAVEAETAEGYSSPLACVPAKDGRTLYIAETGADRVTAFDIQEERVDKSFPMPDSPSGLAASSDGRFLYATCGVSDGRVLAVDLANGKIVLDLRVGHTPTSPVAGPDGKTLYVCNRFTNDVSIVDLTAGKEVKRVAVEREPSAAALTPDGASLFVANDLPAGAADSDYVAAAVSVIDTKSLEVTATIRLHNGSTGLRGVCVAPDGRHAYVTHILSRYPVPTTQLDRGWINTNALSVIDVAGQRLLNTVLLDDVDAGAANPWGVSCTPGGEFICVAHAGTHEVSVIDRAKLHDRLARVAAGQQVTDVSSSADDVPNDLSFLVGLRRRLKLRGTGPRGLAVAGSKVYAAEFFSDSLGIVDIAQARPEARSIPLSAASNLTPVRKGEMFFHDARLCFQEWQSCSSCHPEARSDALNWDLLNDGVGNPKNTKSLLLAHLTPPSMITGVRPTAESAVRAGIQHIQFSVRPEGDAVAIDDYLKSLKPLPSPHLVNGKLSGAARRGQKAFEEAGCGVCHPSPLFTDKQKHNVGSGKGREKDLEFDTPTLIEVWRTAPYLYDGRATTILQVLTSFNEEDMHGQTSELTEQELADLAEFILSQ